jgi:YHS domain-containing protein
MLRLALLLILLVFIARAFWRLVDGIIDGVTGRPPISPRIPRRGVQMVRDPVCGTFVLPERAVTIVDGRRQVFFCSTGCRDKYRARSA